MMMTKHIDTHLSDRFEAKFEVAGLRDVDESVRALRQKAFNFFQKNGFPSIKNEEWRFTNMLPFLKDDYELDILEQKLSAEDFLRTGNLVKEHLNAIQNSIKGSQKGAYRIVSINGQINQDLSVLPDKEMLEIIPLSEAGEEPLFQKHFGKIAKFDGFSAVNAALFNEGFMLFVPDNKVLDKPVHLVNVYLTEGDVWLNPRHLIVLGKNSELDLIQTILPDNTNHHVFVNAVTEIALDRQSHFNHYDIQTGRENMRFVERTEVVQEKHSNYRNYTYTFPGADIVRNNLNIYLDDVEEECHLYGLYFTAGKQLVDNHTEVHHKFPNCLSNQLYKGVMSDSSKGVFNGKIYVYEDAQKTNAFQESDNILLGDRATVNAKPQLEIFADDVKASHGTTVGQLDKEALFYLQSRGIGEQNAKNMLINAFAFDVTQKVKYEALKAYLEDMIITKMQRIN